MRGLLLSLEHAFLGQVGPARRREEWPALAGTIKVYECDQRQAFVTVLDPHVTTRGEAGGIVMTVLGTVAQMERRFIKGAATRGYL